MERGSYMPYQKEMTEEFAMYEAKGDAFILATKCKAYLEALENMPEPESLIELVQGLKTITDHLYHRVRCNLSNLDYYPKKVAEYNKKRELEAQNYMI